ncbi:hypothetical protein GIB67_030670, partial [Kingdonia uniflora]
CKSCGDQKTENMALISSMLCLLMIVSLSQANLSYSWGWFSSGPKPHSNNNRAISNGFAAEFSMDTNTNPKGLQLVENAKQRMLSPMSCWKNAYMNLFAGCSVIIADKEKQSRLGWLLSDCFQKESGRPPFPKCDTNGPMIKCLRNLNENAHTIYLQFYLETNAICHHLQAETFKDETERLVNDLRKSAVFTEEKLVNMEERSEQILENSNQIQNSVTGIDLQIEQVAQTSKNVGDQIDTVLKYSNDIFEQAKEIAGSQLELKGGQVEMREKLEEGMVMLNDSYQSLGQEIENLRTKAVEIEREINVVSESMALKMKSLEHKADDIVSVAGISLDKQKELLDGQSSALEGLQFLSKALLDSRSTLERLAEFGHKQQEGLRQQQEELQQAHDHLVENSKSILAAQEVFESKQANIFKALDKLFTLHNTILLESRSIKAFFFYSLAIFMLYMLTSAKQTYGVRARLYLGLCATFLLEFMLVRVGGDLDQQAWIASKILIARSSFLVIAAIQILHSIFTFRDYEVLNHNMLVSLIEKVKAMEQHKYLPLDMESDDESDIDMLSWIDQELPEEVDNRKDPDYMYQEEIGENSIATSSLSRKYDLRPRLRQ